LYMSTLCIQYQRLSKRYLPEVVGFVLNTICALAPTKISSIPGNFAYHEPKKDIRLKEGFSASSRALSLNDLNAQELSEKDETSLKCALLGTSVKLVDAAADTWTGKAAFFEVFEPALQIIKHLEGKSCLNKLPKSVQVCFHCASNTWSS
jgi:nucleolar protein 14